MTTRQRESFWRRVTADGHVGAVLSLVVQGVLAPLVVPVMVWRRRHVRQFNTATTLTSLGAGLTVYGAAAAASAAIADGTSTTTAAVGGLAIGVGVPTLAVGLTRPAPPQGGVEDGPA